MLSVTILTKNCQETLRATLESLLSFAEVLLLDTGSTDDTLKIAAEFPNVRVESSPFLGFGPSHNLATSLAKYDWIFSVDSDEVVSPALAEEILRLSLNPQWVYTIQRHNFFNGRWIRWCSGWHPDWVPRIYHRGSTQFSDALVHERILTQGLKEIRLSNPLLHTPYRKVSDLLSKMQTYSTLFAEQSSGTHSPSVWSAIFHSTFAFFKSYILKKGFLGGREGFIISAYNGHTTFYKYLKRMEKK